MLFRLKALRRSVVVLICCLGVCVGLLAQYVYTNKFEQFLVQKPSENLTRGRIVVDAQEKVFVEPGRDLDDSWRQLLEPFYLPNVDPWEGEIASSWNTGQFLVDWDAPDYVVENNSIEFTTTVTIWRGGFSSGNYRAYLTGSREFSIVSLQPCEGNAISNGACITLHDVQNQLTFKWLLGADEPGSGFIFVRLEVPRINHFGSVLAEPGVYSDSDTDPKLRTTLSLSFDGKTEAIDPNQFSSIEVDGAIVDAYASTVRIPLSIKDGLHLSQDQSTLVQFIIAALTAIGTIMAALAAILNIEWIGNIFRVSED
ncbi:MAG: hypothetical protein NXH91_11915 [Phyllobacteriaceae bacterium]|nr:hypothetical protein [Phyllobacteriaceae bacterium]